MFDWPRAGECLDFRSSTTICVLNPVGAVFDTDFVNFLQELEIGDPDVTVVAGSLSTVSTFLLRFFLLQSQNCCRHY